MELTQQATPRLVGSSLRIIEILANLSSVVYSSTSAATPDPPSRGIVPLGSAIDDADTQPCILPWLQGTGIVKVQWGEQHWVLSIRKVGSERGVTG